MYSMHVEREIAIAHKLTYHSGKCGNSHGHNLKVVVDIWAEKLIEEDESSNGMIMDFGAIKGVIDDLDHSDINIYFIKRYNNNSLYNYLAIQPTAERLSEYFAEEILKNCSNESVKKIRVAVHEATNQYATYEKELD